MPRPTGRPGLCLAVPMLHAAETVGDLEGGAVGDGPPDPRERSCRCLGGRSSLERPGRTGAIAGRRNCVDGGDFFLGDQLPVLACLSAVGTDTDRPQALQVSVKARMSDSSISCLFW